MDINNIIDKLNNELNKLNSLRNQNIDTNTFFTDNENFNDDFSFDDSNIPEQLDNSDKNNILSNESNINTDKDEPISNINNINYENITPDNETTSLVTIKEHRLLVAQNIFKKSIRVSLKSFLISITISFLNLFI